MNRRHFLSAITAAIAGANYDPERALWTPNKKLISIPKPREPWSGVDYFVTIVEEWWKQPDGRVFRRVDGGLPELTAYRDLPFKKLAPIQIGPIDLLANRFGAGSLAQFVHRRRDRVS